MKKVFKQEFIILNKHQALVEDLSVTETELRQNYKKLLNAYRFLLQDATKITAIGDLNQKKLFEAFETLEKQEAELKIAAAAFESQEGILITDAENIILKVNQAFSKITGYSPEEAIGKTPNFFRSWQHGTNFYAEIWNSIEYSGHWEGEIWKHRKNGEKFPAWVAITAVRDDKNNAVSRYVEMFVDITERKLAEQARQEAQMQATRANQAKRDFLANMSHEIRTPMNAIVGITQLVQRTPLSAQQKNYLNKIETSAQSLLHIIDDILDFSKIEAGKLVLEQSRFLLDNVFTNLLSVVELKAKEKGLDLLTEVNLDKQQYFIGDSVRLTQILINLVGNAIKFTKHGQIIVSVCADPLDTDTTQLYFSVQDSGIGMTEAQIANLFQSFSQADSSTTRKYGGTGLGLSISKALVEMMQGQIWVESELDKGSTFSFIVTLKNAAPPLVATNNHQSSHNIEPNFSHLVGKKILLAEDNEINQELIIELLRDVNIIVEIAENGHIAVEKVFNEPFDLVLMDVQMPEMDGLTATELIRKNPQFSQLPIIAMTANATAEDKNQGLAVGMNDYLTKPIMPEKLIAVLSHWLMPSAVAQKSPPVLTSIQHKTVEIPLNLPGFDIPEALKRLGNNTNLLGKLLLMFAKQYADFLPTLKQLLAQHHEAEIKLMLHTLKSTSGNLEISALTPTVIALEQAFLENNQAEIQPLLAALETALTAALTSINSLKLDKSF